MSELPARRRSSAVLSGLSKEALGWSETPRWGAFIARLLSLHTPYAFLTVVLGLTLLAESALAAVVPLSVRYLIDHAVLARDQSRLAYGITALVGAVFALSLGGLVRDAVYARTPAPDANDPVAQHQGGGFVRTSVHTPPLA